LRICQFDPIADALELPDHSGGAVSLGLLAYGRASFLVMDSLVQNLPDQAAKPVGNHSDGLLVPEARHIPAIEDLEDASLISNCGIGRLIENARRRGLKQYDKYSSGADLKYLFED
jgi:hypothetical protein